VDAARSYEKRRLSARGALLEAYREAMKSDGQSRKNT
jgi:hypothetical protein